MLIIVGYLPEHTPVQCIGVLHGIVFDDSTRQQSVLPTRSASKKTNERVYMDNALQGYLPYLGIDNNEDNDPDCEIRTDNEGRTCCEHNRDQATHSPPRLRIR